MNTMDVDYDYEPTDSAGPIAREPCHRHALGDNTSIDDE